MSAPFCSKVGQCAAQARIALLESALADYQGAVSQAQDALGEYWVTSPTLGDACRAAYSAVTDRQTTINCISDHIQRADMVTSDDPVEAVGQIVDELLRRRNNGSEQRARS